jgi:hypothetical protein
MTRLAPASDVVANGDLRKNFDDWRTKSHYKLLKKIFVHLLHDLGPKASILTIGLIVCESLRTYGSNPLH